MKKGTGAGVALVLFGVFCLINNLGFLEVSVVEIITTYWPLILIWLGVDKLLRNKDERDTKK